MPSKGWKKPVAPKPKAPKAAPEAKDPIEVTPREQVNTERFIELIRCLPEAVFIQMACGSGMQTQQIRELCDLFRKLKA